MAARKSPLVAPMKRAPHEEMADQMNSAIYSLVRKAQKPYPSDGEDLLPQSLQTSETPGSKEAKKHLKTLHKAFKKLKKD